VTIRANEPGDQVTETPELDERKASVLRAIVEEYVETAQPVGSQAVARSGDLGVSSATIRNDMTVLEREGYIAQPHTSAGRVPTDQGYRYFVDHFTQRGPLPPQQYRAVADFFESSHRALEDLLHETSQLLAHLSRHAAVVMGPQADTAVMRGVQLVRLHERSALLVVVLSNGAIERHVLQIAEEVDDAQLVAAARALEPGLLGRTWGSVPDEVVTGDPVVDQIVADTRAAIGALVMPDHPEQLYVGGVAHLAAEREAFSTAQSAARLLEMLEHQVVVVSVVHELLRAGLTVRIGSENQVEELRECALVLAPYEVEGQPAGVVGVLGPTRMDYRHALSAVAAVSQQLGRHLS
jgi:heat-inducible transcriptional repressor